MNRTGKMVMKMFSYKYNNGISEIEVIFYEPFKRFHYCNAATIHVEKDGVKYDYLISYATPIAFVIHRDDVSEVYVNEDSFNCSTSTIRQLSRWLNELDCGCSYNDVKQAMKSPYFGVWCGNMKAKVNKCDVNSLIQHAKYNINDSHMQICYAIH